MNLFKIEIKKSAEKELFKIPQEFIDLILYKINNLSINPFPEGTKKLKGSESLYRIRQGDFRIIYSVNKIIKVITIQAIIHRKDAYKNL